MERVGVLIQECQALEVLLANSEKEKKTWSEICSNTLTSMKGLEAEIEREKQNRERDGREAENQRSEMESHLLQLTDQKQKILMEKESELEALGAKVMELETCTDVKKKQTFENKSLKQSLAELEDKTAKLEVEYSNAIAEKLSLTASLEDYKNTAEKLQTDCENMQAHHKTALDKCDGELLELICERDHYEEALVKSESVKLGKEHKSLQRNYDKLKSTKAKEQAGFLPNLASEKVSVEKKAKENLELQLQNSRAELAKLKGESHTAIRQKDGIASEKTSLIQELHSVSEELEETRSGMVSLVVERVKLIAAVSGAEDSAVKELERKLHLETKS